VQKLYEYRFEFDTKTLREDIKQVTGQNPTTITRTKHGEIFLEFESEIPISKLGQLEAIIKACLPSHRFVRMQVKEKPKI